MLHSPRSRWRSGAVAAAAFAVAAALAGCAGPEWEASASPGGGEAPTSVDAFVDWVGKVHEVVVSCDQTSMATDAELHDHAAQIDEVDHNLAVVMAAGAAIEHCGHAFDPELSAVSLDELTATFGEGTAKVGEWLSVMADANRSAAIAAAGNMDSRILVGELHDHQHAADELADQIDALVGATATELGIDAGEGLGLYRWDPPHH